MLWLELALQSAWSRRHALGMAIVSVAVSTLILLGVHQLREDTRSSFSNALSGVDLVVGPRGSATELMLYSVFQIGQPTRNMSYAAYEKLGDLPQVAWTIPIQLGDSYRGHPVLGTSENLFRHYTAQGRPLALAQGRIWGASRDAVQAVTEVVLGADAAQRQALRLGDRLVLTHGRTEGLATAHENHPFVVVGVLAPTGTPLDRSVLISLEGFEAIHQGWGMGLPPSLLAAQMPAAASSPAALVPQELTAVWVGLHARGDVFSARRKIEALSPGPLMAVMPGVALDELWQVLRVAENALMLIGGMVAASALLGVVAVLLIGLAARRKELAIYRALGASPLALLSFVGLESLFVCLAGLLLGLFSTQVLLLSMQGYLQLNYGIAVQPGWPTAAAWLNMGALLLASVLASGIPAWRAYRLSLTDGLHPPVAG